MAEDTILSLIEQEALAKKRAILEAAERERKNILEGAETHNRRRETEGRQALQQRMAKAKARLESQLALEERRETANVKAELYRRTLVEVRRGLMEFTRSKAYAHTLEALCQEILEAIGPQGAKQPITFVTREEDTDWIRDWLRRQGVSAQVDPHGQTIGGVEARLGSGEVRLSNTFEARMERARHDILNQVAAALAGEP